MKLFVVSTPIGNLKDITIRAVETLNEVDLILCEDTRTSSVLLNHFNIKKELISINAFNESKKLGFIIEKIKSRQSVALISDAGTPSISDPGVRLISACIKNGIDVISIPGPTALIAALSISGLPTDSFVFEGFIPQKKGRQTKLKELTSEPRTVVLYESVYRIEKLINELAEYMPERFIVICREITKKFEEVWRGFPQELKLNLASRTVKGEFVVVIAPKDWQVSND